VEDMSDTKQYMVRITDGSERPQSYGGFRWNPVGEWTEAPDWNPRPVCGGGLHGQHPEAGGFRLRGGTVPELLEIDGPVVKIRDNKVKVRRAKRIAVGDLNVPEMPLKWKSLDLHDCPGLLGLSKGMMVCSLDLRNCTGLRDLPEGLTARSLDLAGCTGLHELPAGLATENLDLADCIGLYELPEGLTVDWLDLSGCIELYDLPEGLKVDCRITLYNCTGLSEIPAGIPAERVEGWDFERKRAFA